MTSNSIMMACLQIIGHFVSGAVLGLRHRSLGKLAEVEAESELVAELTFSESLVLLFPTGDIARFIPSNTKSFPSRLKNSRRCGKSISGAALSFPCRLLQHVTCSTNPLMCLRVQFPGIAGNCRLKVRLIGCSTFATKRKKSVSFSPLFLQKLLSHSMNIQCTNS